MRSNHAAHTPGTVTEQRMIDAAEEVVVASDSFERAAAWRAARTVQCRDACGARVVIEREHVPAKTRGRRFSDVQNGVHGDAGVGGGTASAQHGDAGVARQPLATRYHAARA